MLKLGEGVTPDRDFQEVLNVDLGPTCGIKCGCLLSGASQGLSLEDAAPNCATTLRHLLLNYRLLMNELILKILL